MLLSLLLSLVLPQEVVAEDEIVVLGRQLQQVGVSMRIDRKGRLRSCAVTRSVGDAELDRFWCDAGVACAAQKPTSETAMKACIEARRDEFLDQLAAKRAGGRVQNGSHAQN